MIETVKFLGLTILATPWSFLIPIFIYLVARYLVLDWAIAFRCESNSSKKGDKTKKPNDIFWKWTDQIYYVLGGAALFLAALGLQLDQWERSRVGLQIEMELARQNFRAVADSVVAESNLSARYDPNLHIWPRNVPPIDQDLMSKAPTVYELLNDTVRPFDRVLFSRCFKGNIFDFKILACPKTWREAETILGLGAFSTRLQSRGYLLAFQRMDSLRTRWWELSSRIGSIGWLVNTLRQYWPSVLAFALALRMSRIRREMLVLRGNVGGEFSDRLSWPAKLILFLLGLIASVCAWICGCLRQLGGWLKSLRGTATTAKQQSETVASSSGTTVVSGTEKPPQ